MTRRPLGRIGLVALAGFLGAASASSQPAPDIELVSTSGETVALGDYRGKKILVLHFAASW